MPALTPAVLCAVVMLVALVAYAVFGGADFGGGVLDLCASGARREQQRKAIAHAMGPVWEANHVWLILVVVLLFTAFPAAYQAVSTALYVPLHLVLVGIILRGAAFVFRTYAPGERRITRTLGVVFGASSIVTPVLFGMCLGAIASGRVRVEGGEVVAGGTAWLSPLSFLIGGAALSVSAYVAAVFLTCETTGPLREDFRKRALVLGTVVVAGAAVTLPLLRTSATELWSGLTSARGLPVGALGALAALASGGALVLRRYRLARFAASAQVALLVLGFGLSMYPYLVWPDVRLDTAASNDATLRFVLWSLPIGASLLAPSLWLLFRVFKTEPRQS